MFNLTENQAFNKAPIAIIGLSGIIGNCKNMYEIWDCLYDEKDEVKSLSDIRKKLVIDYFKLINPTFEVKNNCFIKGCLFNNPFEFDNDFFNIEKQKAKYLNPVVRKMLEIAYKAFENAGLTLPSLKFSNTAVYIGHSSDCDKQFSEIVREIEPDNIEKIIDGDIHSKIANYISYYFSLKGPSLMIDTSSSSGLSSVYLAVKALQNNECDIAFAGSCNLNPFPYLPEKKLQKLNKYNFFKQSKSYKTKTFDNFADGTFFGEGAVGLVLKPLNKAIRDGDFIHAVILGGAKNYNFAFSNNSELKRKSKRDLLLKALTNSNISASKLSFIEADGIGIKKQDSQEISAMSEAFSQMTDKKQFCCVGSVKTNFGYTGCVSGLAGILKVVMSMQKNIIPANLNFKMPSKDIDFINTPFFVNNTKFLWDSNADEKYAGVNSYGWTGTNCCLILKNYSYMNTLFNISGQPELFVISAKNETSLLKLCLTYSKICGSINYDYDDFVSTLLFKRQHYNYRFAAIFSDYAELSQILLDFAKDNGKRNKYKYFYGVVNEDKTKAKLCGFKPIDELARFYVEGGTITLKNIKLASNKTVSLPSYEFLKTDCNLDD